MHVLKCMAEANVQVTVTANINIKVSADLKLQPRGHTGTLIFTKINLIYLMINFLCIELKMKISSNLTFIFYRYSNHR